MARTAVAGAQPAVLERAAPAVAAHRSAGIADAERDAQRIARARTRRIAAPGDPIVVAVETGLARLVRARVVGELQEPRLLVAEGGVATDQHHLLVHGVVGQARERVRGRGARGGELCPGARAVLPGVAVANA